MSGQPLLLHSQRLRQQLTLASTLSLWAVTAGAFEFESGRVSGSFDTTISYGIQSRVEERDQALIGRANGGQAFSVNADDGNLNYDKGTVSNVLKFTSELELNAQDVGGFLRFSGFYDYENEDGDRARRPLSKEALDLVGSDVDLLDAYVWYRFDLGGRAAEVRAGNQVLSWGESTFIQNSINTINPVDVNRIRVPGAELREALLPVPIVSFSLETSDNTSLEVFYQVDWEETKIDPPGSYFSSNDAVGDGGRRVQLGFGDVAEGSFLSVSRDPTVEADDQGQFGVAFRWFAPSLNDTEFGFFYVRYHSRLPNLSARSGTAQGIGSAGTVLTGTPAVLGATLGGGSIQAGVQAGVNAGMSQTSAGVIATEAFRAEAANGGPGPGTAAGQAAGTRAAGAAATSEYAATAAYRTEYAEDIDLIGISFNTQLGSSGWALQGEVSHRWDVPLQVDDVELLFAALTPLSVIPAFAAFQDNQIGSFGPNTVIPGFIRRDVTQVQATATRAFGPNFGADDLVIAGEVGVTYVHDMPNKETLRLEGPGTFTSGNPRQAGATGAHAGKPAEGAEHFADSTSWGYRLVSRLTYNNAIGSIALSPRLAFAHDVNGVSPGPGGNFLEGRRALTFGLEADYQNAWEADLSYTRFYGAGRYNLTNDRDFIAATVKYSF